MGKRRLVIGFLCLAVFGLALQACVGERRPTPAAASTQADPASVTRGEYLFTAANCAGCHTDGKNGARLAGGRAIKTSFGDFYSRNITPDPVHGLGAWSDADFIHTLRDGVSPQGEFYYPAFPFPSFTGMSDRDLLDLKAYLFAQPPIAQANKPNDTAIPRALLAIWRAFYFTPGPLAPDPRQSAEWNRGAYLATAVAHCGECHTPRDFLGGPEPDRRFSGAPLADDPKKRASNITPGGIGKWNVDDIVTLLERGMKPDGDFVGAPMSEVVDGTAKLTPADRHAIAVFVKSLPPVASARD